jgi:acetyl-CoA acetyltransferase family protein
MKERLAIIDGIRTPFAKAGTVLKSYQADDLGALIVRELMHRVPLKYSDVNSVIFGNVAQPGHAANIARVVALKAGFPNAISAYTVHRNCASGMESISSAANAIFAGEADIILAGGTESMSNIPLLFGKKMTDLFDRLSRARTLSKRLGVLSSFRLSFLRPIVGVMQGLTDPVCGLIMGLTAENLAKEFKITRQEQDAYAVESHRRAADATKQGFLSEEILPIPILPASEHMMIEDNGFRAEQNMAALGKLKPYFDRENGTVTVGNACPLTDGAAAVLVMSESKAKALGLDVLGYIRDYAYAGLEPERMGLGPVYATHKVFEKSGLTMDDIDLVEMNEAFAAQIIGNLRAFESADFSKRCLGTDKAVGAIDPAKLNINGGAIALGHPVGTTGTRLIITLLKALKRENKKRGLATLCIGGGQGGSFIVETE